jgi:fibronectin-binding autotransporter adhesin
MSMIRNMQSKNPFCRAARNVLKLLLPRRGVRVVFSSLVPAVIVSGVVAPSLAEAAAGRIITGMDSGPGGPIVKAFTTRTRTNVATFFAYTPSFAGGVRVAVGDVNGDGAADIITGSGIGAAHVKVFSGRDQSELHNFLPYGAGFAGGVFVAAGDVNGDGFDDIVTGTDSGAGPHVKVFDGKTGSEVRSFFAYPAGFSGGVRVATGDVNGDGRADIITGAGPGGGPHIKVFDGTSLAEMRAFFSYDPAFTGGVFVAGGDIDGDGLADIITGAGPGGGSHVKVFSARTEVELHSFFAYPAGFNGGVRVAVGDVDGDGRVEILTAPGGGVAPEVRIFETVDRKEIANFLAYPVTATNGVFIGAASIKGARLEMKTGRTSQEIQLQWPSGCVCELMTSTNAADPKGWSILNVQPVENGNRTGLLLPAVQKVQFFLLKCDDEAVR